MDTPVQFSQQATAFFSPAEFVQKILFSFNKDRSTRKVVKPRSLQGDGIIVNKDTSDTFNPFQIICYDVLNVLSEQ